MEKGWEIYESMNKSRQEGWFLEVQDSNIINDGENGSLLK